MENRYNKISKEIKEQLRKIVGESNFFDQKEIRFVYAFGPIVFRKNWVPDVILTPHDTQEISKILKVANENLIPVIARGAGTSLSGGPLTPYGGIVLDLSQMNNILRVEIENNVVEVEPGVICDDLNTYLKPFGYFFPPDPGSSQACTIGGMVANNSGGVQAFKYGVTKDYVLALECVLADGSIIKLGKEVLKSVSSYNLKDLFVGSEGTLGVFTKISLRIKPLPSYRKLGFYIFKTIDDLGNAVLELRKQGFVPILLEFLDLLTTRAVFENLGGEFSKYPLGYVLLADVESRSAQGIEEEFEKLNLIMEKYNPILSKSAKNDAEREKLIGARKAALPALSRIAPSCCLEDCTIKISSFSDVIKKIEKISENLKLSRVQVATFGHMEGNIHPTFLFNENDPHDVFEFELAKKYLYEKIIIPSGGSITGEHGIGKIKISFMEGEHEKEVLDMMEKIKNLFDPKHILNPGTGKGLRTWSYTDEIQERRTLKNLNNEILELRCMRCGFCKETCVSKKYFHIEPYSPRGRLCLLNGLVHGELEPTSLINEIFHACSLCGNCNYMCPSGVPTHEIFEKAREILHARRETRHG
ncbi:MAG: FAD-binding protein [Promethearchaeota archaeon]